MSRKYQLPVGGVMVTLLIVPLSLLVGGRVTQLAGFRSGFCCKTKPVEGEGQEMMTVEGGELRVIVSRGAPGVCTAAMIPQKPPANV